MAPSVCPFARLPVCPFARLPVCPFAQATHRARGSSRLPSSGSRLPSWASELCQSPGLLAVRCQEKVRKGSDLGRSTVSVQLGLSYQLPRHAVQMSSTHKNEMTIGIHAKVYKPFPYFLHQLKSESQERCQLSSWQCLRVVAPEVVQSLHPSCFKLRSATNGPLVQAPEREQNSSFLVLLASQRPSFPRSRKDMKYTAVTMAHAVENMSALSPFCGSRSKIIRCMRSFSST